MSRSLYLVKRPHRQQNAPFHPVILTDRRWLAKWEAGPSRDGAWVWEKDGWDNNGHGWLLARWNGFDIDYGHVVSGLTLPDGSQGAFWRAYYGSDDDPAGVRDLFPGAVWWSDKRMPEWLSELGVVYAPDGFTQRLILHHVSNLNPKDPSGGGGGINRPTPAFWPTPTGEESVP